MIAFEVHPNGKRTCTAGVGQLGVLSTCLNWRGPQPCQQGGPSFAEYLRLDVGGLADLGEHLRDRGLAYRHYVTMEWNRTTRDGEQRQHHA